MEPSPRYAYPDAATREAALALVLNDYEKLAALLKATPAPNLTARDERGQSLLVLATRTAIVDGGRLVDLEGLRLLLAARARPQPDDLVGDEALIQAVAGARSEHAATVLGPTPEGSSVLFHEGLTPAAARVLLEGGVPPDHGTPPGSVLARVIQTGERWLTDDDRADPVFKKLMASVKR